MRMTGGDRGQGGARARGESGRAGTERAVVPPERLFTFRHIVRRPRPVASQRKSGRRASHIKAAFKTRAVHEISPRGQSPQGAALARRARFPTPRPARWVS